MPAADRVVGADRQLQVPLDCPELTAKMGSMVRRDSLEKTDQIMKNPLKQEKRMNRASSVKMGRPESLANLVKRVHLASPVKTVIWELPGQKEKTGLLVQLVLLANRASLGRREKMASQESWSRRKEKKDLQVLLAHRVHLV